MALSEQEKEALYDHYHNVDLYDPSKEPDQDPATFTPKAMCSGGEAGYAKGGVVKMDDGGGVPQMSDFNAPDPYAMDPNAPMPTGMDGMADFNTQSVDTKPQVLRDAVASTTPPNSPQMPVAAPQAPQQGIDPAKEAQIAATLSGGKLDVGNSPAPANPSGLAPDQYAQLVQALSARPGVGQSAMSGLAGLADAIETGVARGANPGFQKNITEQQQQQREALIAALEAKFKGQQFGLEKQKASDENTRAANALAAENARSTAERRTQERGQDIAASTAKEERGVQASNQAREATQAQREADLKTIADYGTFKSGGPDKAAYEQALARLKSGGAAPVGQTKVLNGVPYHQAPNGKWYKG